MPSAKEEVKNELENIRRGFCPNQFCRRPIIFRSPTGNVQCRSCSNYHPILRLRSMKKAQTKKEAFDWIQRQASDMEKNNEMGAGRLRMIMKCIDGIVSRAHCHSLFEWFSCYGVTNDGRVEKLSQMGRTEPLNVVTLSNYAFGLRLEHLNVAGYGRDQAESVVMRNLIDAINEENGKRFEDVDALVPLTQIDKAGVWNSMTAISRACVGREIFLQALVNRFSEHIKQYATEYKEKLGYTDDQWAELAKGFGDKWTNTLSKKSTVIDLAFLANMLSRTILLMDADQPRTVEVFLPYFKDPEKCHDTFGRRRSPLVLAWPDKTHSYKVAMVATAGKNAIDTVRLPREWFKSVWGFKDKKIAADMLSQYLEFDTYGRCVVANGKYFKPEHLSEFVKAFGNAGLHVEGVHPVLAHEYLDDTKIEKTIPEIDFMLMQKSVDGQLWRCLYCDRVNTFEDTDIVNCASCSDMYKKYMRKQNVDGSIQYETGDHTLTPAPNSWCFTKRKHFYEGREYDNPPMGIQVELKIFEKRVTHAINWFSNESDTTLNSNAYELAHELVTRSGVKNPSHTDFDSTNKLVDKVERRILMISDTYSKHLLVKNCQLKHFYKCLAKITFDELFDDSQINLASESEPAPELSDEVKEIIESAVMLYEDFRQTQKGMTEGASEAKLRELWEKNEILAEIEDGIIRNLETATSSYDDEQRWQLFSAEPKLFAEGGFFFIYADRRFGGRQDHFKLPLLGDRKFTFPENHRWVAICIENAEHFVVDKDVIKGNHG